MISKREYGTTKKMSELTRRLPIKFHFTKEQSEKIAYGRIPMEMGDRWFIFMEENLLYCHWWSGECIYTISFNNDSEAVTTKEITVVNDEGVKPYKADEIEINDLISLIKYSLLGGQNFEQSTMTI